jgi:hypothetical protein
LNGAHTGTRTSTREVKVVNHKMPKPPTTERRFGNSWGELAYLCRKIRFWLYTRKQRARAAHYLDRLEGVLGNLPENDLAIIREEGWALFCELNDELDGAIAHREREIQLIKRLHREAESARYDESTRAYMLQGHGAADLQDRRAILQALRKAKALQHRAVIRGGH